MVPVSIIVRLIVMHHCVCFEKTFFINCPSVTRFPSMDVALILKKLRFFSTELIEAKFYVFFAIFRLVRSM